MAKKRPRKAHHKRRSPLHRDVLIVFGVLLFLAGLLKACAPAPPPPEPVAPTPLPPPQEPAPSPIEEVEEEPEEIEEPEVVEEPEVEDPPEEVVEEEVSSEQTHRVLVTKEGFEPSELTISIGDTVVWENQREINSLKSAVVVGNSQCNKLKSKTLGLGESYEYTFTKIGPCQVIETIIKPLPMKITVE